MLKQFLLKSLKFLNLTDRSNNLSISNVAVIVILTKIAIIPEIGLTEAGALLITLMNYSHKRLESNKAEKQEKEIYLKELEKQSEFQSLKEEILELKQKTSEVDELKQAFESKKSEFEEVKKMVSQSQLAKAFVPRRKLE